MSLNAPGESTYLGKYQILKHIATGGMGAVYQAMDTDLNREVALKVLPRDVAARPAARERLKREAELGARLRHENIVALYEFGEAQGTYFLVMEFVNGKDVSEQIERQGPLNPDRARHIVAQMAAALNHLHNQGFVHRDIKPSNILLTRLEGRTVAKLADLGLIVDLGEEEFRLTREGHTVGTVDYLAPEQARDSRAADIRSDIYSLGCTLYHMVTGSPPFPDGTLTERLFKHAEVEPPDIRNHNPRIPAELAAICKKMLRKLPEDRYQTPAELLDDLANLENQGSPAPRKNAKNKKADAPEPDLPPDLRQPKRARSIALQIAEGQFELAKKALAADDRRYALRLLLKCCQLDPGNTDYREALRGLGTLTSGQGSAVLGSLAALWNKLLLRGARMLKRGDQVLYFGEKVLADRPNDLKTHLCLAEAAVAKKDWSLAKWFLDQAQRTRGEHVLIHRARAFFWEQQGDIKHAMGCWELVDKADPGNREARHHLMDLAVRETMVRTKRHEREEPSSSI